MAKNPSFFLDFKKFEHVKSDDKTTTLKHPMGHEITISHKSVSPELRTQLEAFSKAIETDKKAKLAAGGTVKIHAGSSATRQSDDAPTSDALREISGKPEHELEDIATDAQMPMEEPNTPVDEQAPKAYAHGSPSGVAPGDEAPSIDDGRSRDFMSSDPIPDEERDAALLKLRENGTLDIGATTPQGKDIMASMMPPEPELPAQSQGLMQPAMAAEEPQGIAPPATDPNAQQPGMPSVVGGYQKELAGINATADAQGKLGDAQAKQLEDSLRIQQESQKHYQQKFDELEQERQAHLQDIRDGHIDPEKYWATHSKVATGIGMILAGFNPTNSPNAAINFLNHQMDKNLEAQAKNLDSKNNLLAANLKQFGNLKDATEMTKIMQHDALANQLQVAAAKAQSPLAKAAALEAAGKLEMQASTQAQAFANMQATKGLMATASQDPSKIPQYIAALYQGNPEAAKAMAARHVPGVGLANTEEGGKGVREMQSVVKTAIDSINRLKEIVGKTGKSMSPNLRAEADTIRSTLIGALRVPITGPGAMSEGERALLERTVPDVTGLTSLDSNSLVRLKALTDRLNGGYANMIQANGMQAPKALAPMEIKTMNGVKYQKVGNAWHKVK